MTKQEIIEYIFKLHDQDGLTWRLISERLKNENIANYHFASINKMYNIEKARIAGEKPDKTRPVKQDIVKPALPVDDTKTELSEAESVKQELSNLVKQIVTEQFNNAISGNMDAIKQDILNTVKQMLSEKVKQPVKQEKDIENIDGWNIQLNGGYYRAFKRYGNKLKGVYLGKTFDIDQAKIKIQAKVKQLESIDIKPVKANIKQNVKQKINLIELAKKIDARPKVIISILELRAAAGMKKKAFDNEILRLDKAGKIFLREHAHPYQAEQDGTLKDMVTDEAGKVYMGISIR